MGHLIALLSFLSLTTIALAQCATPEFYPASEIIGIGNRAFGEVLGGSSGCDASSAVGGNVWLIRPGDSSFQPIQMGYFDAVNGSNPNNTMLAPSVQSPGYGYQIIFASDPSSTPVASSGTFALVTQDWFQTSYDHVVLVWPNPASQNTQWSASGQQLIAYQAFEDLGLQGFTVLIYSADDVTQTPVTVIDNVPVPSIDETVDEFYFTIANTLPSGSNYQLVLVPSSDETDKVLAVSGLIQVQDGSGNANPFPYTYTQVRTLAEGASSVPASSSASSSTSSVPSSAASAVSAPVSTLPGSSFPPSTPAPTSSASTTMANTLAAASSSGASTTLPPSSGASSTSASSALPLENPYPTITPTNPSAASTLPTPTGLSLFTSSGATFAVSSESGGGTTIIPAASLASTAPTQTSASSIVITSGGATITVPAPNSVSVSVPPSQSGRTASGSALGPGPQVSPGANSGTLRHPMSTMPVTLLVAFVSAFFLLSLL